MLPFNEKYFFWEKVFLHGKAYGICCVINNVKDVEDSYFNVLVLDELISALHERSERAIKTTLVRRGTGDEKKITFQVWVCVES